MGFFQPRFSFINQFLVHFQPLFSQKQWTAFQFFLYALLLDFRRCSLSRIAQSSPLDYQRIQYFFSESKWDLQAVNNLRLKLISHPKTTRPTPNGVLALDDTACAKPFAQKTEGAAPQYCSSAKQTINANVAVASCFVSPSKHFPINFQSYLPESTLASLKQKTPFKSKLQLAMELIDDALQKNIAFSSIVFDSWYASSEMLSFIHSKNLHFVSEVKSNRYLLLNHPIRRQPIMTMAEEVASLLRQHLYHKFQSVQLPGENGTLRSYWTYSFSSRLKQCDVPVKVVILFGKWSDQDALDFHVFITNNLMASTRWVLLTYLLRWGIEQAFRELKDSFYFDQYQVRHQKQIQRHWVLSFLAWTLTYWIKQNGVLSKSLQQLPSTLNGYKESIATLLILDSAMLMSKNKELAFRLAGITSDRLKRTLS